MNMKNKAQSVLGAVLIIAVFVSLFAAFFVFDKSDINAMAVKGIKTSGETKITGEVVKVSGMAIEGINTAGISDGESAVLLDVEDRYNLPLGTLHVIYMAETSGGANIKTGDSGESIGPLQITKTIWSKYSQAGGDIQDLGDSAVVAAKYLTDSKSGATTNPKYVDYLDDVEDNKAKVYWLATAYNRGTRNSRLPNLEELDNVLDDEDAKNSFVNTAYSGAKNPSAAYGRYENLEYAYNNFEMRVWVLQIVQ